ncbi:MAG: cell surface protein, partial [Verrucomicrobiota bacterium]|nr:cell surface protein [Verrucomicrobiota bacterium]
MKKTLFALLAAPLLLSAAPKDLVDLQVYPKDARLVTLRAKQQLMVQATYADSTTRDVTALSKYTFADPKLVKFENHIIRPVADGETSLKIEFAGRTLTLPVKVEKATEERPVRFSLDVMPTFTKGGCNSGGCHGASSGKDGFRLSLFGFDPRSDYQSITRENLGRRINLALP